MNNYEYLIASLPDISAEWKGSEDTTPQALVDWLRDGCSSKDRKTIDFLLKGFESSSLDADFYTEALSHGNSFIREYFRYDLNMRNEKVAYLNRQLGRGADEDIFMQDEREFDEKPQICSVLESGDILAREKGLDDLMWTKIENLTVFNYFDIEAILAFIAKLQIIMRWQKLDKETGKQMFERLVDEVRGSFTGVREAANEAVK